MERNNNAILGWIFGLIVIVIVIILIVRGVNQRENTTIVINPPAPSTPTTPTQNPTIPVATTTSTASPTDTTAIVSGSVTPNGAFTTYWYEYGTTPNLGSQTTKQSVGSGYLVIPAPGYITGLTKNTTYHYRLVTENQFGRTTGTTHSFQTTASPVPAPLGTVPRASTNAATSIGSINAVFNGTVVPNGAKTAYWYEYGTTSDMGNTTEFITLSNTATTSTSVPTPVEQLQPGTTYHFRLNAQNQFGTVQGTVMSFTTTP